MAGWAESDATNDIYNKVDAKRHVAFSEIDVGERQLHNLGFTHSVIEGLKFFFMCIVLLN